MRLVNVAIRKCATCGGEFTPTGNSQIYCHICRAMETRVCSCGCGKTFNCMHKATQRFVSGHNSLGRIFKFSEQALTRLKEQRKNDKTYGERMKKINAEKKGKTWEQLYGIDGAKRLKEDAAKRRLGTKHSNETKHKMTITKIGNKNPMHGMSGTLSPV